MLNLPTKMWSTLHHVLVAMAAIVNTNLNKKRQYESCFSLPTGDYEVPAFCAALPVKIIPTPQRVEIPLGCAA